MNPTIDSPSRPLRKRSPWSALLYLLAFSIAGFFVAQFATLIVAIPFFGLDQTALQSAMANPEAYPEFRVGLLVMQAVSSATLFIFTPWVYLRFMDEETIGDLVKIQPGKLGVLAALTAVVMIVYMPISGMLVQWNEQVVFPESLKLLEQAFRAMEDQLKELTEYLIKFDSVWQFLLGMFVIAVLPGVGEELLFRGVLQNRIKYAFGNVHVAIWLAAFLFSAIHFQFYGLLPRMALGALFGYLYHWSGSLVYPMLAHFINNGFTLTMMYLFHQGVIDVNLDEQEEVPLAAGVASVGLVALLLVVFRKKALSGNEEPALGMVRK